MSQYKGSMGTTPSERRDYLRRMGYDFPPEPVVMLAAQVDALTAALQGFLARFSTAEIAMDPGLALLAHKARLALALKFDQNGEPGYCQEC